MSDPKTIGDLIPDPKCHGRVHGERNIGMIEQSLRKVGAARSIVIDDSGNILAGHGTIDAAANVGITKLKVVDADGDTIVAVRRSGLTEEQKISLAIYDNRTNELSGWDMQELTNLRDQELINLNEFWYADELPEGLLIPEAAPRTGKSSDPSGPREDQLKKIVLEFEEDDHAAFVEMIERAAKFYKTVGIQETLVACMREITRGK